MKIKSERADFPQLLYAIYEETPNHGGQLREVAKQVCCANVKKLMGMDNFREMLLKLPELPLEVMDVVVARQQARVRTCVKDQKVLQKRARRGRQEVKVLLNRRRPILPCSKRRQSSLLLLIHVAGFRATRLVSRDLHRTSKLSSAIVDENLGRGEENNKICGRFVGRT